MQTLEGKSPPYLTPQPRSAGAGIPRISHVLDECSTTELHPQPFLKFVYKQDLAKFPRLAQKFSSSGLRLPAAGITAWTVNS